MHDVAVGCVFVRVWFRVCKKHDGAIRGRSIAQRSQFGGVCTVDHFIHGRLLFGMEFSRVGQDGHVDGKTVITVLLYTVQCPRY